jgi:hypothetical protein
MKLHLNFLKIRLRVILKISDKLEQYSLKLIKRIILNFQSVWRHRSELGFVPGKGTLA